MNKKWFGASLLVLVLALTGCSEEKAKSEKEPKTEQTEKNKASDDMAKQQAKIIKNLQENAVELDPATLESDPKAYEEKVIKAVGTVNEDNLEKGMGGSFELKVGETNFKVMNFTMGNVAPGSDVIVYGNVKTGKDAKSGLSLINATYIE
ncbi:hypothetical protein [Fictibacillus phosphorivorans]|uniref:hypothetical protein n=1 Tax=Fictibacillus phosphorivorans TaxID=1221500 RepID=UPI00203C9706|nr:hypothetical protein [Fictibacillus phosphorivorans]MCM3718388.1 hypothetical protein [Fictibacillus phosphorivorans]MCM3776012.1 hypothetical protein [Fictibacillus phosphorivorans]